MIKTLTSSENPLIKKITKLAQKKERFASNLFIAEGIRTCVTLLENKIALRYLFFTEPLEYFITEIESSIKINNAETYRISPDVLNKISHASTPSGIVGVFVMKPTPRLNHLEAGLVCYNLQDPGNVGTLLRSAAAMAKKSVVLINSVDAYHPKVVQAAAGTLGYLDIFTISWAELLATARYKKLKLCALVVKEGKSPHELDLQNTLLVVGNEGQGLEPAVIAACDNQLTLPMPGQTESLNVAVAGSIALYLATQAN